jgi:hypothetical protein
MRKATPTGQFDAVALASMGLKGGRGVACGTCGRPSAVTPCLICDGVIAKIVAGDYRTGRTERRMCSRTGCHRWCDESEFKQCSICRKAVARSREGKPRKRR